MAKKSLIFIDIDGTLMDEYGHIPDSAKQSIKTAKENGHRLFLSTGRTRASISDEIVNLGFEGIIGAGGTYIELGGQKLLHEKLDNKRVREAIDYFDENEVYYFLESSTGLYVHDEYFDRLLEAEDGLKAGTPEHQAELKRREGFISIFEPFDHFNFDTDEVAKFCFFSEKIPFSEIKNRFGHEYLVLPSSMHKYAEGGEIGVKGHNKSTAIDLVVAALDVDDAHIVAFGDGANDHEMIENADIGVAMGNAHEALIPLADYVTHNVDDDGLYKGFVHLGLI